MFVRLFFSFTFISVESGEQKNPSYYDEVYHQGGANQEYFKHYTKCIYYKSWCKVLELIKKDPKPSILEIGCGPGQLAEMLFDNKLFSYRGIDYSQEAIKMAKERNSKFRTCFYATDAFTFSYSNIQYNTVVVLEVLEHIENDLELLKKIPNGKRVIFSVPNFDSAGHVRWFSNLKEVLNRYSDLFNIQSANECLMSKNHKLFLVEGIRV